MAELKGLVLSLSRIYDSPARLLSEANRILAATLDARSFITMTYAVVDTATQTMRYARAGHNPMIHLEAGTGRTRVLTPAGLGLGIDEGARFDQILEEAEVPLRSGDLFLFFTDGLSEAMDRPQQYSNVCPSLYGFIPRTLCAERVGALCSERTGRPGIHGDGDPMDVCVLTEKEISHGDILVQAVPIGGLRMIDGNEADDKIIAVLSGDAVFGSFADIAQCPAPLVDRLRHYFLTYKQGPDRAGHAGAGRGVGGDRRDGAGDPRRGHGHPHHRPIPAPEPRAPAAAPVLHAGRVRAAPRVRARARVPPRGVGAAGAIVVPRGGAGASDVNGNEQRQTEIGRRG